MRWIAVKMMFKTMFTIMFTTLQWYLRRYLRRYLHWYLHYKNAKRCFERKISKIDVIIQLWYNIATNSQRCLSGVFKPFYTWRGNHRVRLFVNSCSRLIVRRIIQFILDLCSMCVPAVPGSDRCSLCVPAVPGSDRPTAQVRPASVRRLQEPESDTVAPLQSGPRFGRESPTLRPDRESPISPTFHPLPSPHPNQSKFGLKKVWQFYRFCQT